MLLDESSPNLIGDKDFLRRLSELLLSRLGFEDFGFHSRPLQVIVCNNLYLTISQGHVGIGTTAPVNTLNVASGRVVVGTTDIGNVVAGMAVYGATNGIRYGYQAGQDSTHNVTFGWNANSTAANGYSFIESYGGNNPIAFQTSGGNVGIGTTTPLSALHVNGTLVAGGTARTLVDSNDTAYFENNNNYTQFHMYNSGATVNAYVSINKNGNLAYGSGGNPTTPAMNIWTGSAHPVRFGTNNAQAMIIDSSQNVGIG